MRPVRRWSGSVCDCDPAGVEFCDVNGNCPRTGHCVVDNDGSLPICTSSCVGVCAIPG